MLLLTTTFSEKPELKKIVNYQTYSKLDSNEIFHLADSIRIANKIPEIGYAIFSGDSVYCENAIGYKNMDTKTIASTNDWLHIGSNTKALLGFIAAELVEQKLIQWNTNFFDLYPELKEIANPNYFDISLLNLLSHRAGIKPYKKNGEIQNLKKLNGTAKEQRYEFSKILLREKPSNKKGSIEYSNAGYLLACMMLEKVTGKSWQELIDSLGKQLSLRSYTGWPNQYDSSQPIGHINSNPVAANYSFPLPEYFYPSGNLSLPFNDYIKFVQVNLKGLHGDSTFLKRETFEFLHYGVQDYAIGWAWKKDNAGNHLSTHNGSAGTFICHTYIINEKNIGIITWGNSASENIQQGIINLRRMIENKLEN